MPYCPTCNNDDIVANKMRGPADAHGDRLYQYEYFCGNCGRMESMRENADGFSEFYRRWNQRDELDSPGYIAAAATTPDDDDSGDGDDS